MTKEKVIRVASGWNMLGLNLGLLLGGGILSIVSLIAAANTDGTRWGCLLVFRSRLPARSCSSATSLYSPTKRQCSRCLALTSAPCATAGSIGPTRS